MSAVSPRRLGSRLAMERLSAAMILPDMALTAELMLINSATMSGAGCALSRMIDRSCRCKCCRPNPVKQQQVQPEGEDHSPRAGRRAASCLQRPTLRFDSDCLADLASGGNLSAVASETICCIVARPENMG